MNFAASSFHCQPRLCGPVLSLFSFWNLLYNVRWRRRRADMPSEKNLRGMLRSAVSRAVAKDCVLIVDSLNSIKVGGPEFSPGIL